MKKQRKIQYHIPNLFAKKFIFVDGLTRSGKGLLSPIIPSLQGIEKINVCELFDMQIVPAMSLGLDENFARAFLRCYFNELAYDTFLSRNVNFRRSDLSGIYNHHRPALYFERLKSSEETVKERLAEPWAFPFKTHDLLANREHLDKLGLDYSMIELIRNPVDLCYSWYRKGLGRDWGKDLRTFALKYKQTVIPYYAYGREEEWLDMSEKERCIEIPMTQMKKCVARYRGAEAHILLIRLEDLRVRPDGETDRICDFLKAKRTAFTARVIKGISADRRQPKPRETKIAAFKGIRKKYRAMLMAMDESYNDSYGMR
ncbi:MAG: sulfotransferase domain-containing protein [Candidatus Omnitrophica bacterium]|nr:sulfotransferase domain-containing protein [Candidatus Omnitrophota bacterium]